MTLYKVKGATFWSFKGAPDKAQEDVALRLAKDMVAAGLRGIELDASEVPTCAEGTYPRPTN